MPGNEVHMGMISLLFPETNFVHMVRHPLDSVLASFFIDARHGDNYATDLATAAEHYALTNETVRRLEDVTGKLDECSDVSISVQDIFYSAGRLQ